jgi:hypothetical protein
VRDTIYRGAFFTSAVATDLAETPLVVSTLRNLPVGSHVALELPADRLMLLADDTAAER